MYLQWFWYIISLPTLISCTHNSGTARSVTESKKDKTLANNIFIVNVFAYLYACVCVSISCFRWKHFPSHVPFSSRSFVVHCNNILMHSLANIHKKMMLRWIRNVLNVGLLSLNPQVQNDMLITRISEYICNIILIYKSNKFLCGDQIVCYTLQV